jgi:ADP-ribose pyrophosphatase YjhB (NUDIX family)
MNELGDYLNTWYGSAGISINDKSEILMVLQGTPEEVKTWSVPSGGLERGETFEECCKREIEEETGYIVDIVQELQIKKGCYEEHNLKYEVHYFLVKVVGGSRKIQDPDQLIYDIRWVSLVSLKTLELSFPEDREYLISFIEKNQFEI